MPRQTKHLMPYWYKKGESGNPAGCPRGSHTGPNLKRRLAEALMGKMSIEGKDGQEIQVTGADLVILKLFERVSKGDVNAIKIVMQYIEGMPVQSIRREEDGAQVTFKITLGNELD